MNRINKKAKIIFALFIGLFTVTVASGCSCSCTSSMCSEEDESNIKKAIEKQNIEEWRNTAALGQMKVESDEYTAYANSKVEELYLLSECGKLGNCSPEQIASTKSTIKNENNNAWLNELEALSPTDEGYIKTRTDQFQTYVNEKVDSEYANHPKACLVTSDDIDPSTGAKLQAKSWKEAWKAGLLDGLIVYPIGWLLSSLTSAFGGGAGSQLLAILIAVIIIRILMLAMNFKGQIGSIKMQSIQGEVNEISAKLKDPKITDRERQMLSMKMMEIYKSNNINPLSTLLTSFISFPIFIAVWAAMNQTLAIRKGTLFGMSFGDAINSQIFKGNITAIILFILMIAGQLVTMRLSTWLKVWKEKKKNPNYKKKEPTDAEKQMNIMLTMMIVMVVMSGFVLPAALVIYWFLGSVFSIIQTLLFSSEFMNEKLNRFANRKKKAKVVK